MLNHQKSLELVERANQIMPGPHANLRSSARIKPIFVTKALGSRLWDVDGNEYIDYVGAFGPGILGHGNDTYVKALQEQLQTLYYLCTGDLRTTIEVDLAEKIVRHVPGVEKVRFVLSGTETVQLAIRLARAYTDRRYFIRFEGHYHGWLDNILGGKVDDHPSGKPYAVPDPHDGLLTLGRDPGVVEQSFLLPWNDIEALEKTLEKYADEVALILMEPILLNSGCSFPRPGYLESVRELCDHYGIVLCFDEVQTGFRVGLNCAQGLLGVTPDLSTFGKALGGGIPMGAVGGKSDIMNLLFDRRVIGAGTFNGYPFGLAACLATLTALENDDGAIYRQIVQRQSRLLDGIKEIANRRNIPFFTQGSCGIFFFVTTDLGEVYTYKDLHGIDWKRQSHFERALADEGILVIRGGRWFISGGLTEADVGQTLEVVDRVMGKL
jgi:glutamate-1-semialdehyde 2,1-aminomutase